jgi:hypothetical protein
VAIRRHDPTGLRAANEALAPDPTSERLYANQMRLHLALGEPAAALKTFARYSAALVEELGLPPAPQLEALHAEARDRSRVADPSRLAPSPQPATLRVGVLPIAATTFVGRAGDLADVGAAFETSRLVTITGPAGVGKSRLALELAHRLKVRHRDGVRGVRARSRPAPGWCPSGAGRLGRRHGGQGHLSGAEPGGRAGVAEAADGGRQLRARAADARAASRAHRGALPSGPHSGDEPRAARRRRGDRRAAGAARAARRGRGSPEGLGHAGTGARVAS